MRSGGTANEIDRTRYLTRPVIAAHVAGLTNLDPPPRPRRCAILSHPELPLLLLLLPLSFIIFSPPPSSARLSLFVRASPTVSLSLSLSL